MKPAYLLVCMILVARQELHRSQNNKEGRAKEIIRFWDELKYISSEFDQQVYLVAVTQCNGSTQDIAYWVTKLSKITHRLFIQNLFKDLVAYGDPFTCMERIQPLTWPYRTQTCKLAITAWSSDANPTYPRTMRIIMQFCFHATILSSALIISAWCIETSKRPPVIWERQSKREAVK